VATGGGEVALGLGGGVFVVPVLHERLESADAVRRACAALAPDAIAVEVPSTLSGVFARAIDRLPAISVLLYETAAGETIYLPVQPADATVEAARLARERGIALCCADLDVDGYGDHRDPVPDAYALHRLGWRATYDAFRATAQPPDERDARREAALAYHARRLVAEGKRRVLVVAGMRHVEGLAAALARSQGVPFAAPVRENVRLVHLHPESLGEVLGEPPLFVAAYEAERRGVPAGPAEIPIAAPAGRSYGPFRVLTGGAGDDPARLLDVVARVRDAGGSPLDRARLIQALAAEASRALEAAAPDERVEPWQRRNLFRFGRRLARASRLLLPDLFDLVVAARGTVSDNFAWELHRLATSYPWQTAAASDAPTARIRAEEMWDGVRRVRLTRRLARAKTRRPESILRRRRREEAYPGEWLGSFDASSICSYPPEDAIVEAFGGYLRKKGRAVLSEEGARTVPFTTSVRDGIDVRETIRRWAERRIYVRELGHVPGEIGAIVAIFDDDLGGEGDRFPYRLTWLGEHSQESDMAFYATAPEQGIVGPGICRVTYGGFLLSYPPGRLADVWTDPDYRLAESKPEILLMAALDYSRERIVVHAAAKPPRPLFRDLAARLDRKILHLPLGTLSPATLRKIRVMHILAGHDKRQIAKDYVW